MVFLKLVHAKYQVNHKTQPFWINVVHQVPNIQTIAGHSVGAIRLAPITTQYTKSSIYSRIAHWIFYFLIK